MSNKKNIFVYAVCGDDEYIDTLNISLKYLKAFSKNEIIVVTDSKRNNKRIDHDNIIDISTPTEFTNHQASIYIKTSLHKYLDSGNNYCYLDSDVIAVNKEVDDIFQHFNSPITFAKDHCKFEEFSPYAINCGCKEKTDSSKESFYNLQKEYSPDFVPDKVFTSQEARKLYCDLLRVKQKPFANWNIILKYIFQKILLPCNYFKLNSYFKFDKKRKIWINGNGEFVMADILSSHKEIEKNSEFRFDRIGKYWKDSEGRNFFKLQCNHLQEEIFKSYNINIYPKDWQHWNGGVFLFNDESSEFLDSWNELTLKIFKNDYWKTRDQASLATTVWKFDLQDHITLPEQFNFIADFYKPEISYDPQKGFTKDNFASTFNPFFIHVYHHFGDDNWNIWQYIRDIIIM